VLEWTAECELRSLHPAAVNTSASTQIPPPPRPTVTRGATTEADTSPPPLTAPATSVLTTSDRSVLGVDIDPRKKWGPEGGAEVGHVPGAESDSEVEKATQARLAPTGKLKSQSAQPKTVYDCDVLSLGKFANKAQQTAAISGALPRPPPLPVQPAPGSQVPQLPEAAPAIQSPQPLATPKPALTQPPPFGTSLGPPRVSMGEWMDQQCAVVSELCEAVSGGMRMLDAERVWTTEERDRAEKALTLMSEESDKAGKALILLSKVEDFLKGKEPKSTNVATQTEEPATSAGTSVIAQDH